MALPHPHQHRCFYHPEGGIMSAIDIRESITTGGLSHFDVIVDSTGCQFYAKSIGYFQNPLWLRTLDTDPICGLSDADCDIADDKLLDDMSDGDLENMPPSFTEWTANRTQM